MGRFLSQDRIGFDAGDANLYRYVGNNPVGWSDPYGLFSMRGLLHRKIAVPVTGGIIGFLCGVGDVYFGNDSENATVSDYLLSGTFNGLLGVFGALIGVQYVINPAWQAPLANAAGLGIVLALVTSENDRQALVRLTCIVGEATASVKLSQGLDVPPGRRPPSKAPPGDEFPEPQAPPAPPGGELPEPEPPTPSGPRDPQGEFPEGPLAPRGGVALNVVESSQTAPARFVRTVKPGETIADLIAEGKSATWVNEAEHAIVSLAGKGKTQRVVVSGGRDGIQFIERNGKLFFEMDGQLVEVRRVIGHTHPRATGPSQGDLDVLGILGQRRSYIIEIGGEPGGTVIRPK